MYFARQLLSLPGGIRFRRLNLGWSAEDGIPLVKALVEECHRTLEFIEPRVSHSSAPTSTPITQFCYQSNRGQLRSTSRKRQSSKSWFFASRNRTSNG